MLTSGDNIIAPPKLKKQAARGINMCNCRRNGGKTLLLQPKLFIYYKKSGK
jgi:hypothetical protein